ncbi:hypothetical protein [Pseudoxanthobacter soli]|uniref:hypothetical protein n=1 Tax=Pseudoxanthobacter soli TaxID=433840 RepID=UPI001114B97C|nr:hypothetical protein [Pseudoxanthobacter soli]
MFIPEPGAPADDRLVEARQVTIHRLLWEYGRDSFGERAGKSFSEDEWWAWLAEIANRYRSGIQEFSLKSLNEGAWSWLLDLVGQDDHDLHGVLFRMLTLTDAVRFG